MTEQHARSLVGSIMDGEFITSKVLADHLGVSSRTLRRLADAYSQVHGALPTSRPTSRTHVFSLLAVERIKAAHLLMRDVPGLRAVQAFEAFRDGAASPVQSPKFSAYHALVPVMTELSALRAEMTYLRSEVLSLRALLRAVVSVPEPLLPPGDDVAATEPGPVVPMWRPSARQAVGGKQTETASLHPSLTRLLSDLEAGYTLLEARGEVVLLTPRGQQVRLVDPRTVAALIKQGRLSRDACGLQLTVPPITTPLATQNNGGMV